MAIDVSARKIREKSKEAERNKGSEYMIREEKKIERRSEDIGGTVFLRRMLAIQRGYNTALNARRGNMRARCVRPKRRAVGSQPSLRAGQGIVDGIGWIVAGDTNWPIRWSKCRRGKEATGCARTGGSHGCRAVHCMGWAVMCLSSWRRKDSSRGRSRSGDGRCRQGGRCGRGGSDIGIGTRTIGCERRGSIGGRDCGR